MTDALVEHHPGRLERLLGPDPWGTVCLPIALTAGALVLGELARGSSSVGAIAAGAVHSAVVAGVVLSFANRRRDLLPWVLLGLGALSASEALIPTLESGAAALAIAVALWSVALGDRSNPSPAPWRDLVRAPSAVSAALIGASMLDEVARHSGAPVIAGAAAALVLAPMLFPPWVAPFARLRWPLVAGSVVLAAVPAVYGLRWVLGGGRSAWVAAFALFGVLAAVAPPTRRGTAAEAVAVRVAGSIVALAAVVALTPQLRLAALTLGGWAAVFVAFGGAEPVLRRARSALGGDEEGPWLTGAPLLLPLLGAGLIAGAQWVDSLPPPGSSESTGEVPLTALLVVAAVSALVLIALPWAPLAHRLSTRIARLPRRPRPEPSLVAAAAVRHVAPPREVTVDHPSAPGHDAPEATDATVAEERANRWDLAIPVGCFVVVNLAVSRLAAAASEAGGRWPTALAPFAGWFDPTGRIGWGTGDYHNIASYGYRLEEHREAFLPVVPLILRAVRSLTGLTLPETQVLVAEASGLACAVLTWIWLRDRGFDRRVRAVALGIVLLFPWSFILYGYGYADATVMAFVLGAFVLVERERPIAAGLVGALAAGTRPNGIPIIASLLLFELLRSGALRRPTGDHEGIGPRWLPHGRIVVQLGRMRPAQWGVLLSVSAIAAYSIWMWGHAGDPLYWGGPMQEYYGHEPIYQAIAWFESTFSAWPTAAISGWAESLNQLATAVVVAGSLAMIPAVHRRFGAPYSLFVVAQWTMAWTGSRVYTPSARLLLPALPFLAAIAAEWVVRRGRATIAIVLGSSAAAMAVLVVAFTRGGELWVGW